MTNAVPDKNLETSRYHSRRCPLRAGVLYLICFPGVDLFVRRPGYLRELPHYGPLLCYMES